MKKHPKVGFLLSHPIQYFSPLMKEIADELGDNFKVYYCSDHGITEKYDTGFGKIIKWDIPLLDGYHYEFIPNQSPKPSVSNFSGLINLDLVKVLSKEDLDILIVHGWGFFSNLLAIAVCNFLGIKVWLRAETPLNQELLRSQKSLWFRKLLLKQFLFKLVDKFLFIGSQNKDFYRFYGAKEGQLVFTPYSIDNKAFDRFSNKYLPLKQELRNAFSINENDVVIMYCGKYIPKKRPLDLIESYSNLAIKYKNISLVMVGEGELRPEMERLIQKNNLEKVYLSGFINQSEIVKYYAVSDIFALTSESGETWGLVANEAMNFSLPIVISDLAGCSSDLVIEGENGFTYPTGDIGILTDKLELLIKSDDLRRSAGLKSKEIIKGFSNKVISENITGLLNT